MEKRQIIPKRNLFSSKFSCFFSCEVVSDSLREDSIPEKKYEVSVLLEVEEWTVGTSLIFSGTDHFWFAI